MMQKRLGLSLAAVVLAAGLVGQAPAIAAGVPSNEVTATDLSAATKKTTVKRTTVVRRPAGTVRRTTTVRRANGNVARRTVVVRRPYRAWVRRPYYGSAIIGGIALGTVIAVSAAHAYPAPPGPNACWYWSNPAETHGYWDYCTPP